MYFHNALMFPGQCLLPEGLQNYCFLKLIFPLSLSLSPGSQEAVSISEGPNRQQRKREGLFSDLGPLKDSERRDLNCAIKEYLLFAGYRLTAMTFYEEVSGICECSVMHTSDPKK